MKGLQTRGKLVISHIYKQCKYQNKHPDSHLDELLKAIILVSGLIDPKSNVSDIAETSNWTITVCEELYEVLFAWAEEKNKLSYINNMLPVYLGLIKDEETKKPGKNLKLCGCRLAVSYLMEQKTFPENTEGIIRALMKLNSFSY